MGRKSKNTKKDQNTKEDKSMKRKSVFLGVLMVCSLLFTSFALDAWAQGKKIVIGASMVQKDSDWWAMMARLTEQAAKAKGYDITTVWANADQEKQIKDVEDLIQRKVDIIVMGPVQQDGSMVAIDQAFKAGIPVVTVARISKTPNVAAAVVADEPEFGRKQIQQIAKDYPNGANIVFLFGPVGAGYAIQMFEEGTTPELKKFPNLKLLHRYTSPSDIASDGMKNAEDGIVRFSNIDVFAASNDGLALGAVRAVQSAGKGDKIKVYGAGATLMGMQAVYDGQMRYTTIKSQAKMAELALGFVETIVNKKPLTAKLAKVPPVVVTKENVLTVKDPMLGGSFTEPAMFAPKK
jgi:ABC-type sugar transport system substrate-binding protein